MSQGITRQVVALINVGVILSWHAKCVAGCMSTIVAMPVWNDQVSTTLDFSERLIVLETDAGREITRKMVSLNGEAVARKVRTLQSLGIHVLICGAISQQMGAILAADGVRVMPFTAGAVEEVLVAWLAGSLPDPALLMPGCCGRMRRRQRGGSEGRGRRGRIS